ncbi:hypothetical protein MSG28_010004 [Choristoneura fumiferana]|uniref:Uncharacterized protein n=1 Tax=Choristoneura fumiferana TaxID=7141 RepID=A0ACC0KJD1_CHOFU|nr:hypothetical protein MSG28_010004 [Choristoneura fumiferana]
MAVFGPLVGFVELREAPRLQEDAGNVSSLSVGFTIKAHLSVAIVAMTQKEPSCLGNFTGNTILIGEAVEFNASEINCTNYRNSGSVFQTYDWSKKQQEIMLFAFFVGYTAMMLPMGSQFGTIISFQLSGIFCGSSSFGWPFSFWLWGGLALVCFCMLAYFGSDCPQQHKTISNEELAFIMGDSAADAVPKNGILSSLPYISMYCMALVFGWLADFLRNHKFMSLINIRRFSNSIGMVLSSVFLLWMCYVSTTWLAINQIDLAPNFAGPMMGLGNMVANLSGLAIPFLVSDIVGDDVTYDWSKPVQEMILGAFFVGYCLMMFPTGIACQRYGGKLPLQMCLLINGIISIATPTVAVWSGLLSSLPYVACAFATMGYGVLSDFCTNRGYLSLKAARIICNTLAQAGPALCLVAVSYTDDSALAVFLLIVALGLYAGIHSGWMSGFLSSLPYIGSFFFCIAYGVLSDYCVNRGYVTLKTTRIVCNTLDKPKVSIPSSYGYGMRHVQSCLLFLCVTVAYMARAHLGVSVVAMTRPNDKHNTTNIIDNNETAIVNVKETGMELNATGEIIFKNESMDVDETSFHNFIISHGERISEYNNTLEDIVIGNGTDTLWNVYRVNYIDMSPNFSGSLMAVGNTGCGAGVLLLPVLVSNIVTELGGWVLTVIFRIIQGLSQSCIVPSMHTAFGKWTPLEERGRLTSFAYGVPWKKLMRSWGLYAIVVAHTGYNWGNLTLYSEVPAFMDKIMKVNIKANGLLTALPYFVQWFSNFFFSWVTDMIIVKKYLSVTNTRKLANSIGSISSTIGLITLAFVDKDIYVVETILVTICAFSISTNVGYHVNHIDIAPNFAGTLMSISNFVSNCVGSLAPIVAGCILTDVTSEYLWRKVFCVSAGFFFVTNLFYVIFGTAELADWNEPEEEVTKEDEDPMLMKERR